MRRTTKATSPSKLKDRAKEYSYSVVWSNEDDAFIGRVLEFPLLATHGGTPEDALREIRRVVEDVLSDLVQTGESIPEPLANRSFSGRLLLRMPSLLHRQLVMEAQQEGVSLNQWITVKLASPLRLK